MTEEDSSDRAEAAYMTMVSSDPGPGEPGVGRGLGGVQQLRGVEVAATWEVAAGGRGFLSCRKVRNCWMEEEEQTCLHTRLRD